MEHDDYKEMRSTTTKKFSFNDGENWHYEVTAFGDCVVFKYIESGIEKESFDIPTWVASRMLPVVSEMAKEAEE